MRISYLFALIPLAITLACGSTSNTVSPLQTTPTDSAAPLPDVDSDAGALPESDASLPSRELAKGVWSLDSEMLAANDADLAPLGRLMQGAEVVGIGETWHTTGGQHQMRARAVRYLVEHEGFRHVMLETPWITALPLTRYVATGENLKGGIASIFGVFASTHMRDLMVWLRAWNVAHPTDAVQFHGFDVQENAEESVALKTYVRRGTTAARADALLAFLPDCYCGAYSNTTECFASPDAALSNGSGGTFPPARDASCKAGLDALDQAFQNDKAMWVSASSEQQWKEAVHVAKALRAGHETETIQDAIEGGYMRRDEAMKTNVLAFGTLYGPAKAVLMAHNGHLERSPNAALFRAGGSNPSGAMMGGRLYSALGAKYKVIGQVAYDIKINWPGMSGGPRLNTNANSIEKALEALARPYLLVDALDNAVTEPNKVYTTDTQGVFGKFVPAVSFDALLFMHRTDAMVYAR